MSDTANAIANAMAKLFGEGNGEDAPTASPSPSSCPTCGHDPNKETVGGKINFPGAPKQAE